MVFCFCSWKQFLETKTETNLPNELLFFHWVSVGRVLLFLNYVLKWFISSKFLSLARISWIRLHMPMNLPLKDRFTTFLRCIPVVLLLCNAFLGYYLDKYVYFFVLPLRWWCWILQDRQRVMGILLVQHEIFMRKE